MSISTHYYVLSLSALTSVLFEAFRDQLITVANRGFPVTGRARASDPYEPGQLRALASAVEASLGHHYVADPLRLVVVGESALQSAFNAVTTHGGAVIGRVDGDHAATTVRDLGQIVWPVVREAMSGSVDRALCDLEAAVERGMVVSGLEAVARTLGGGRRGTLLVEDDYRVAGSIARTDRSPAVLPEVDVREAIDDAVDAVIEKVLASCDNVVFTPGGSLREWNRVVLLLSE